ncbi:MAG: MCE family protein [Proteobacteria bacterium]|nr:MCE family protein [Pseudomonadota bacterium]
MQVSFSTMEKVVGSFILLIFFLFVGSAILVGQGQKWFKRHVSYFSIYKEGYNLAPGAKVRLLRTDIGEVTEIELTENNRVRVTFRVLEDYASRIRLDSKAAIESPTIIGDEYVNILLGSKNAALIPPGGEIPSKEQKKLSDYLEELDLEHKLLLVDEILDHIEIITDRLDDPDGGLFGTLNEVKRITGGVADGKGSLGRIIRKDELYNQIMAELKAVDGILAKIRKAADHTAGATGTVEAEMPVVLGRIQDILGQLQKISRQLEKAMQDVPEISQEARQGMRDVNEILDSVKKNFLIRGNLPPQPAPESHGVQVRG